MRKLVVGLGNPGQAYVQTRHNVGFMVLTELASRHGLRFSRGRAQTEEVAGLIGDTPVLLARPQTFMNESGRTVAALIAYHRIAPADLLVVVDDLDRPFGQLRFRATGSSGGHNGLKSIIAQLGHQAVPRLKIGIGRPPGQMPAERYVLLPFAPTERELLPTVLAVAADAIEHWLGHGLDAAGAHYNGWAP